MDIELISLDKSVSFDVLQQYFYFAATDKVDRLCLPSGLLDSFPEAKDSVQLAAQIDFPDGLQPITSRIADMLYTIRHGAKYIDVVVNNATLKDGNLNRIKSEFKSCFELCRSNKVKLRAILEYRLHDSSVIYNLCETLCNLGVGDCISATGRMPDEFEDNLLACRRIQDKFGINMTFCGRLFTKDQLNQLAQAEIHGARITSIGVLKNLFEFPHFGV